jgi:hypothetical protein
MRHPDTPYSKWNWQCWPQPLAASLASPLLHGARELEGVQKIALEVPWNLEGGYLAQENSHLLQETFYNLLTELSKISSIRTINLVNGSCDPVRATPVRTRTNVHMGGKHADNHAFCRLVDNMHSGGSLLVDDYSDMLHLAPYYDSGLKEDIDNHLAVQQLGRKIETIWADWQSVTPTLRKDDVHMIMNDSQRGGPCDTRKTFLAALTE